MWNRNQARNHAAPPQYNAGNTAPQMNGYTAPAPVATPNPAMPQNPGPVTYQQPAPANAPQPANPAPPAQTQNAESFISNKICKVNAKNKVLDFSDMLVRAYTKDYANIHGTGGKDHAPNSGICLTLCDYTKGTGTSSVTVKFIIDVRQVDRLLCAAEAALNGTLGITDQLRGVREFATANGMVIGWLQGNHQPTLQEVAGLQQVLCAGLTAQDPECKSEKVLYSYEVQKNNPYKTTWENGTEFTPVSTLSIQYVPARKYPWIIKVSNFMAPISRQQSGATTHNNKAAVGKKEIVFPMSADDFYSSLSDVAHYIRLWEYRMYPVVNAMCTERERRAEAKRQQRQN